jgi:hypothetical protein
VASDPYGSGALTWPAGAFAAFAGQNWEVLAAAYSTQNGFIGASGIAVLNW